MIKRIPSLFLASLASLALASCQQQHTHAYDLEHPVWEWSQFSSATLSFACSDCDASAEGHTVSIDADITVKESVAATCESAGYKVYEASVSFEERTFTDTKTQPVPASGHSEDKSVWNYDNDKHWHPCSYCGDSYHYEESEHEMTEWAEILAPTYHEDGAKERHCTVFAYTEQNSVDKLRYSYEQVASFAKTFSAFSSDSPYLGESLNALLDSIENMDEKDKDAHSEEVAKWLEEANNTKASYERYYTRLVDTEGLDVYEKTKTSVASDETYGNVLKVNGDEEQVEGECWSYGTDRKASLVKEGVSAVRFAIYAPQPMNVSLINGKCTLWYDASSGKVLSTKSETTIAAGTWREFVVPTSAISEMDDFRIALYLSPSPFIGYGIPTSSDSEEKGSAYVSEIIGVKDAYYKDMAGIIDEEITELSAKTLTMWDGGQLRNLRSNYDALPSAAKDAVQNLEQLVSLEATYSTKWSCLNTSWTQGKVKASTQIRSVTEGHDETYGLYAEFDASDSWIVHFTPVSEAEVDEGAQVKIAIYKPEGASVSAYYIDNSWGNVGTVDLVDGWNVVDVPSAAFLDGKASGISIGLANAKEAAGYKFTPLYIEK